MFQTMKWKINKVNSNNVYFLNLIHRIKVKVLKGYSFKDKISSTIVKAIISLVLKFNIKNKVLCMIFFFTVCVIYFFTVII